MNNKFIGALLQAIAYLNLMFIIDIANESIFQLYDYYPILYGVIALLALFLFMVPFSKKISIAIISTLMLITIGAFGSEYVIFLFLPLPSGLAFSPIVWGVALILFFVHLNFYEDSTEKPKPVTGNEAIFRNR